MKSLKDLVRKNIYTLSPYSTARDEYTGNLGMFLDANESPYDDGFNRYPDPRQRDLKTEISKIKDIPTSQIFLGNGSDEAIDLCFRVFCNPGQDNIVAIDPSYGMYEVCADINDIEVRTVKLNEDFSLPAEKLISACDQNTKLLFICNPNNPTGNLYSHEDLEYIIKNTPGIVVLDEAYIDFAEEGSSMLSRIDEFPNLIILQTFSKAWGMAGIRLGLAYASEEIMGLFSKVKYPYNVNVLTQRIALEKLKKGVDKELAQILSEREIVKNALLKCSVVEKIYPSSANFLLVRVENAKELYEKFIQQGVIVRDKTSAWGCANCLRITIGTPMQNRKMLEIVKESSKAIQKQSATQQQNTSGNMSNAIANIPLPSARVAQVERMTKETKISISVDLDGNGASLISTGLDFFDHMLEQIPNHSGISLSILAEGDLQVDEHHTIEDVGIALGEAIIKALGDKKGIERYGFALPMDECDAMVLMDLGGRIDFAWDVNFTREYIGDFPTEMFEHFFQSLCSAMKCNLHIKAKGVNNHHLIEGVFKAFARTLRQAVKRDIFSGKLPSSKGVL